MANADQTCRSPCRWPQVTLRETLLLMTFFAVLYGLDVMRGDQEALLGPVLLGVFLLWRIVQHCRGVEHAVARVFIDATLGAAIGTMATGLGMYLLSLSFSDILAPLLIGASFGAIAASVVGLVLRRYRRKPTTEEDQ